MWGEGGRGLGARNYFLVASVPLDYQWCYLYLEIVFKVNFLLFLGVFKFIKDNFVNSPTADLTPELMDMLVAVLLVSFKSYIMLKVLTLLTRLI